MRLSSLFYSLFLLFTLCAALLTIVPGCVPPASVDPDAIPDPTTLVSTSLVQTAVVDGVRSTTVTWPDIMSTVTYPTLPPPPANCRITRMLYRTYKSPGITAAMGTIEGLERYYIYTSKGLLASKWAGITTAYHALFIERTVTFRYDATGRLVEEVSRLWNRPADTVSYRYETGRILHAKSYWDNKLVIRRDTLPLDSRGLSRVYPGYYRYGIYDNEGYLVVGNANKQDPQSSRVRVSVSNGNYVNLTDSVAYTGENRTRYLHYVNQPNVPNKTPFYGKQSRQLLAHEVSSIRLSPYYRDGDKYSTRYMYLFDNQGRVRRSIAYGKTLAPDWPFVIGAEGINIIDYEYACP